MAKQSEKKLSDGTRLQGVPLTPQEDENLEELKLRFQEAVIARNHKFKEKSSANVSGCDIMRAGLEALKNQTPEEIRVLVLKIRDGRQSPDTDS